jgi:hypothetical protein
MSDPTAVEAEAFSIIGNAESGAVVLLVGAAGADRWSAQFPLRPVSDG